MENKVNLNLIKVLILLKTHRSMRTVAKILGKSESAISKDISKLRNEFDDDLFIKTQEGFKPTYYLNQIYPELESAYTQLINIVSKPIEFQPHLYKKQITIAIASAEYERMVPLLYSKISAQFPQAKLSFTTWRQDSLQNFFQGKIDCGIHLQNENFTKDLYQKTLKLDQIVTAVHRHFGITQWEQVRSLPFAFIDVPGWNEISYRFKEVLPKDYKADISYGVKVDTIKSALDIATQSRTAIQVPTRYLNDDFVVIPYPKGVRFNVAYSFYCLQTERYNPLTQLLHTLVSECYLEYSPAD